MSTPRILALGAHPDDVEIYCLGLLLRLKAQGWDIGWVVATDGLAGLPSDSAPETRRQEAMAAGALVGVEPILLGLEDGGLTGDARERRLVRRALEAFQPTIVVTHGPTDYHPDHRFLSAMVSATCPVAAGLLYADCMLGHGFLPDFCVDVSAEHPQKMAALAVHETQNSPAFLPMLETWSAFRALHTGVRSARFGEGYQIFQTAANQVALRRLRQALEA